jgi:hypothetical protein
MTQLETTLAGLDHFAIQRCLSAMACTGKLLPFAPQITRLARRAVLANASSGTKEPNREDLNECFRLQKAGQQFHENDDPLEDVAVGCVHVDSAGSFRVLLGCNPLGDFYCSDVVAGLSAAAQMEPYQHPFQAVIALLQLSEALIARAGLPRYCEATRGDEDEAVCLDDWEDIRSAWEAQLFTASDLEQLSINAEYLIPFVFGIPDQTRADKAHGASDELVRKPILRKEEGWILACPLEITVTIRMYVLAMFKGGWPKTIFEQSLMESHVNALGSLFLMRAKAANLHWQPPKAPDAIPNIYATAGRFDGDKIVHVVVLPPSPEHYSSDGAGEFQHITDKAMPGFGAYLDASIEALNKDHSPREGITLLVKSTVGEGFVVSMPNRRPNWTTRVFTIHQILGLGRTEDFTLVELLRWSRHMSRLEQSDVQIHTLHGAIELFAAWRAQGGVLLTDEIPTDVERLMLVFDGSHSTRWITQIRHEWDDHLVSHPEIEYQILVVRYDHHSFWPSDRKSPVYVPLEMPKWPMRAAFIERVGSWWIEAQRGDSPEADHTAYELWKCVTNWVERLTSSFEQQEIPLGGTFRVKVSFKNLNLAASQSPPSDTEPLEFRLSEKDRCIWISVLPGFLTLLHEPQNVAESLLVAGLLEGIAGLTSMTRTKMRTIFDEVVGNVDARFFHVMRSWDANLLQPESGHTLRVTHSFSQLGEVQWEALRACEAPTFPLVAADQPAAVKMLEKVVDHLWVSVENQLAGLRFEGVARRALDGFGQIERHRHQWRLTARSLFAVQPESDNVAGVIAEKEAELNWASICHRLVIETGMYVAERSDSRDVTEDEFGKLLCLMRLLIGHAHLRDLIASGLARPPVVIRSNGRIDADDTFLDEVAVKHVETFMTGKIEDAVESYEETLGVLDFEDSDEPASSPPDAHAKQKFEDAYEAEFGFSIHQLAAVVEAFSSKGMKANRPLFFMTHEELKAFLSNEVGLATVAADKMIVEMSLPRRRAWDKDLKPWRNEDVYPWRYRRALSLLCRPWVFIERGSENGFLLSPGLLLRSFEYLERTWKGGRFPQEMMRSSEMKSFAGSVAEKAGKRFETKVAQAVKDQGWNVLEGIKMEGLGAIDPLRGYGDIDVLAWKSGCTDVYVVECKNFMFAATIGEVADEISSFAGEEGDYLWKHFRRIKWLADHPEVVQRITANTSDSLVLVPTLVTSQPSPLEHHTPSLCPSLRACSIKSLPLIFPACPAK